MKEQTIANMPTLVPQEKRESKYRSLILGSWIVLLGSAVIVLGIVLIFQTESFTPWLLVPFAGGVLLTTYGGNIASREASRAAALAISQDVARVVSAWRGGKSS